VTQVGHRHPKVATVVQFPRKAPFNVLDAGFKGFNKGDVLVATWTEPKYTPIMKLASAIVTDEGGLTSHAAIVSRELNIPCVIGTKNATKVLKTGDMVEVDANNGVVKIINK
jgi:phosphoenolpyruvate synthase/pyruvate phosphate dikinase